MPIAIHVSDSWDVRQKSVMLTAPESIDETEIRPWIYIYGPGFPDGVKLVLRGAPSYVLRDWLIEHMELLVRYQPDYVLSCLRGEDLLCDQLADTMSSLTPTQPSRDASLAYHRYLDSPGMEGVEVKDSAADRMLEWYRLQAIAARIHRRRRKN